MSSSLSIEDDRHIIERLYKEVFDELTEFLENALFVDNRRWEAGKNDTCLEIQKYVMWVSCLKLINNGFFCVQQEVFSIDLVAVVRYDALF
jgi:hypothetical protein